MPSRLARGSLAVLWRKRHQLDLARRSVDRRPLFQQPLRNQNERDSKREHESGDQCSRQPSPVRLPNEIAPNKEGHRHQDKRADKLLPVKAGHGTSLPYSVAVRVLSESPCFITNARRISGGSGREQEARRASGRRARYARLGGLASYMSSQYRSSQVGTRRRLVPVFSSAAP